MTDLDSSMSLSATVRNSLASFTKVNRDIAMLHYKFRNPLELLLENLVRAYKTGRTKTDFQLFEGFRDPLRQDAVFKAGASNARAWQSAHQYGLAADIVAFNDGKWSWDSVHDWAFLKRSAAQVGLSVPISNDRVHVQSPLWQKVRLIVL